MTLEELIVKAEELGAGCDRLSELTDDELQASSLLQQASSAMRIGHRLKMLRRSKQIRSASEPVAPKSRRKTPAKK